MLIWGIDPNMGEGEADRGLRPKWGGGWGWRGHLDGGPEIASLPPLVLRTSG